MGLVFVWLRKKIGKAMNRNVWRVYLALWHQLQMKLARALPMSSFWVVAPLSSKLPRTAVTM